MTSISKKLCVVLLCATMLATYAGCAGQTAQPAAESPPPKSSSTAEQELTAAQAEIERLQAEVDALRQSAESEPESEVQPAEESAPAAEPPNTTAAPPPVSAPANPASAPAVAQAQVAASETASVGTYALALEAVEITNAERRKAGLAELTVSQSMMEFAQLRAEELMQGFSHTRPNGTLVSSLGYGENISSGRTTAKDAVNGWMNSAGHKANILNDKYEYIGIGYYAKDGSNYWVQLFSWHDEHGNGSSTNTGSGTSSSGGTSTGSATYTLNATELSLTAEEGYQLSVDVSGSGGDMRVEWSIPSIAKGILSVDDSGYVTTYYRDGMSSATATITVTAKVYDSGKLAKTLTCKVIVTQ